MKQKNLLIILLVAFLLLFAQSSVLAEEEMKSKNEGGGQKNNNCPKDAVCLDNPLGNDMTLEKLIGQIIRSMLGLAGSAALVMFVYGGFTWVLSAGNPESMQRGKNILIWAVVGLIVIFSSYALVRTLLGGLS